MEAGWTVAALWAAVIGSGIYHGLNPGMGWPLAVSAAMFERRPAALVKAMGLIGAGHFVAMCAILLPLGMMTFLVGWESEIRLVAGLAVAGFGLYLLLNARHPRHLARVAPTKLALWAFLAALAHGAALMLVPIYLGLCAPSELDAGHQAAQALMIENAHTAFLVGVAHTAAMMLSGGLAAFGVYWWLGPKAISRAWFNLDRVWALCLIAVGGVGLAQSVA